MSKQPVLVAAGGQVFGMASFDADLTKLLPNRVVRHAGEARSRGHWAPDTWSDCQLPEPVRHESNVRFAPKANIRRGDGWHIAASALKSSEGREAMGDSVIRQFVAFALFATGVQAQPETVNVEHSRGLDGLWKISVPAGFAIGLSGPAKFGPMRDLYCRITEEGEIHCLSGGYAESGTAALEGDKVHIAWGSMMARMAIDATYKDGGLIGTFTFKLSGIRHDAPEPSIGAKVMPPKSSDVASAYLAALMTQLAAGNIATGIDAKAIASHDGALPTGLTKLGDVEATAFLGSTPRQIGQPEGELYSVHIVEFSHGERLCGVHRNGEGVLDRIRCV